MNKLILVINAGSSSIKFKLFDAQKLNVIASGLCERIFIDGVFGLKYGDKKVETKHPMPSHKEAIQCILDNLQQLKIVKNLKDIVGVGHRVVLAGEKVTKAILMNKANIALAAQYNTLAPLHNPPELEVIKIMSKLIPNAIQVGSFDNMFHTTMPPENYLYPINQTIASKYKIRRYGAHGNSYRYINQKMQKVLNNKKPNLIVCHLGNGASMCAIKEGKSFATTMGLTPLEGLIMGTRCGDVDPSIATYLARCGFKTQQIDDLFNKQSGMEAITGSRDMRDVEKFCNAKQTRALIAMKMYANAISKYILHYANLLENKVDGIIFTAGVGENSVFTVNTIINNIKLINLSCDIKKLQTPYNDYKLISTPKSQFKIYCVRTDEELMIVNDVLSFLK